MNQRLKRACRRHLRETFGISDFRPGQQEAVHALLSCRDVMCILPTGAGKSLCWQLPAVVHDGLTVVVSPLIALMRDQVQHLLALGIPAVSLDSLMESDVRDAAMQQIRMGKARIVFVSPERLLQRSFRQLCRELHPWMLVVDEAHCIVQWGESFRPAYAAIGAFLNTLAERPVLCAMTATADQAMQRAICESLNLKRVKTILLPVIRENLVYEVRTTLDSTAEILRLTQRKSCKTLIFCRTRLRAERLAVYLSSCGVCAAYYHAGMSREERIHAQQRFVVGEMQVMCATTAFGMGVDVPDIRRIIHDEMPDSVIDYVQQTGRAGRDGQDAECILFLEPDQLVRRADLRRKTCENASGGLISRWMNNRRRCRNLRQLMQGLLSADCIPAWMARAFGQHTRCCGRCSACQRGSLLHQTPDIGRMKEWQVRGFVLSWQRDALAAKNGCAPRKIIPDAALNTAAKKLVFPADAKVPQELERLLAHFRRERVHDFGSTWIS